jgi:hypothetical protein
LLKTFELLRSMTSNVILFKCHLSLIGGLLTANFTVAKPASITAQTFISFLTGSPDSEN